MIGRAGALLLLALSPGACARDMQGVSAEVAPAATPAVPVLAIRASGELAEEIRRGTFFRWVVPELKEVKVELGPQAAGDAQVLVGLVPAAPELAAQVKGLPVDLAGDAIVLAGTPYRAAGQAAALRLPGASRPTWVVVGRQREDAVSLADEVLFRLAAALSPESGGRGRRRRPLDADYLVRETPYMGREGKWAKSAAGAWTIDRAADQDDLADWDRTFAALAPIRGEKVTLLVAPGDRQRPEMVRLAAELDRAAAEMAPRVPLQRGSITVVVEPDHVSQGRHTGEIGEAVSGRRADLHLVWDPRDLGAYRYSLARRLIQRTSLANKSPLWIERGAALWLSGDWYGKPWREWLPLLAAARVLPAAEDLLAGEEASDASAPLWTPVAAAIVDRLPGDTLAEKLSRPPGRDQVATLLDTLARSPIQNPKSKIQNSSLPFLAGISLAMRNGLDVGYHAPSVARQLDAFSALGANAVSVMPFAYQPGPDRPEISYLNRGPGSETDIGLIHATRTARERGFRVLYKPHLWIPRGGWPGDVEMKSEEDWTRWWRSYRRFVLHHAFLARWARADLFSVGCELSKTVKREAEWRDLIAAVRLLYPGVVTYSGNWYGDLEGVHFWDALDVIGIDSYYPLAVSPQAARADLDRGAREIANRFAAASKRTGKRILLTEVGFAAHKAAWVAPHIEGGEASEEDQAVAYQALFAALDRQRWLAGTFVWKAFSSPGAEGRGEADFRFQGRKAEGVIGEYYRGDSLLHVR